MLSRTEFEDLTNVKTTEYGWYLTTQTKVCAYGQVYPKKDNLTLVEAVRRYLNFYYTLYMIEFTTRAVLEGA